MRKLLIQSLLYAFCAMLPSCYTATESTSKINDAVVEKIEKREEACHGEQFRETRLPDLVAG